MEITLDYVVTRETRTEYKDRVELTTERRDATVHIPLEKGITITINVGGENGDSIRT